ncbi:MAG: 5-carboxymethyl-2-hydroxymuconate Delta-isomerase [Ferruginibacter sp.]
MPHFVIECSENVIKLQSPKEIIEAVYQIAISSNLFAVGDIKVRIMPYTHYTVAGTDNDFIHVFAYIMQGRNTEQKAGLSNQMVRTLKTMLPNVPVISMNVMDFEKDSYCNRSMV